MRCTSKYNPEQSLPPRFALELTYKIQDIYKIYTRYIGVIFDTTMSMLPHVINFFKSAFYRLSTISRIRKYLSSPSTEILIHTFGTSKLDHCNSLLYINVPKIVIKKLQWVQNAAARLITRSRRCDHITPILFGLHWLPVS